MFLSIVRLVVALFALGAPTPNLTTRQAKPAKKIEIGCVNCFAKEEVTYNQVYRDLVSVIQHRYSPAECMWRQWSRKELNEVTQILVFGNNNQEFRIPYRLVLGVFQQESHMCIIATSGINYNGTRDFGLGQHNSNYMWERLQVAAIFANRYEILGRTATIDPYDPYTNGIATIQYIRDIRVYLDGYGKYNRVAFTQAHVLYAYNSGISGMLAGNVRPEYVRKVNQVYLML